MPAVSLGAGQTDVPPPAPLEVVSIPAQDDLEGFDYAIDNGLYATITAMNSFKKPEVKDERKIKLKDIPGFRKAIEVRAVVQDKPAPLVVIFLGLASKSKGALARLWTSQLQEAGCHVLVFDSIFRPSFNERSCHGVSGNLQIEAAVAANVISAFQRHPDLEGKVTKLGLLGASYGGALALNYAKLAREGKIKQAPDKVLVFSPPLSMRASATILDKFYEEYDQNYNVLDLFFSLKGAEPVPPGRPVPFEAPLMRAGIGYTFREDLDDAIACSKDVYDYRLPKPDKNRKDDKDQHAFTRFIEQVVFPYWQKNGGVRCVEDLWEYGNLAKLLQACPDNVHVYVAADDPLNDPVLLKFVQRDVPASKFTVLPRGGHLGFVGCRWTKERVVQTFKE